MKNEVLKVNMSICPICHKNPRRRKVNKELGDCCIICHRLKKQEENLIKLKKKNSVKDLLPKDQKKCSICNNMFVYLSKQETECRTCYHVREIRKSNELWVTRGPRKPSKFGSSGFAYSFFRKKYSIPNIVYRG